MKKILFYSSGRADRAMLESIKNECKKYFECKITESLQNVETTDYLFILGDRWNVMSAVTRALKYNIPTIHQGGGEVSEGSYDDVFRKMYSQAAQYHFVINDNCKINLNKMGITKNIFVCGSPRMDYVKPISTKKYLTVLYHPATKHQENYSEIEEAVKSFDLKKIYIKPGDDIGAELIPNNKEYSPEKWRKLLSETMVLIGNTSAGISEAPSYEIPFVNVGHRQDGREKLKNVIDCKCKKDSIIQAINKALTNEFKNSLKGMENTFSDGQASKRIAEKLIEVL